MKKILMMLIFSITAIAQTDSNSVSFITYWANGESHQYSCWKKKTRYKEGNLTKSDSASFNVTISVVDSSDTNYVVNWQTSDVAGIDGKTLNFLTNVMPQNGFPGYTYEISEVGEFKQLLNYNEVYDYIMEMIANLGEIFPDSLNIEPEPFKKTFSTIYNTRESMELYAMEDVLNYHFLLGSMLSVKDTLSFESSIPNPFNGMQIPTENLLFVDTLDTENSIATVVFKQYLDEEKSKQMVADVIKKVMSGFVKDSTKKAGVDKFVEELKSTEFRIYDTKVYVINYYYGWLIEFWGIRTTETESNGKTASEHRERYMVFEK